MQIKYIFFFNFDLEFGNKVFKMFTSYFWGVNKLLIIVVVGHWSVPPLFMVVELWLTARWSIKVQLTLLSCWSGWVFCLFKIKLRFNDCWRISGVIRIFIRYDLFGKISMSLTLLFFFILRKKSKENFIYFSLCDILAS